MKKRKFISVLLAASFVLTLLPATALTALTANYPDPVYNRFGTPEVAIFNAYTVQDTNYLKKEMVDHFYNAVSAAKFTKENDSSSYLSYQLTVTDDSFYVWKSFARTNLALLSDRYGQLKVGYTTTLKNNSHTHRYGFLGFYAANMTSWMISGLYCGGIREAIYSSRNPSSNARRWGEGSYELLPDVINGANSRLAGVNPYITRDLQLDYRNSTIYYDSGNKACNCGGTAEGCAVTFFDGTAPTVTSVEIKNGDTATTNFKAGDVVTVVLHCSEAIRFADDSATGKGNVFIGLKVEGTNDLHAHLTRLDQDTLTFTYAIPANETQLYTILGIALNSAPQGEKPLVQTQPTVPLVQVYGANRKYNPKRGENDSKLGFTVTTSQVTDMAGNALTSAAPAVKFYIDCEKPYAAWANINANANKGEVKAALGKTGTETNSSDASDQYLGTGDSFDLTVYMNEKVTGDELVLTTNVMRAGEPVVLTASFDGFVEAKGKGLQYGRGASGGYISTYKTPAVVLEEGMTVNGSDGIKITGISYPGVADASGNLATDSSAIMSPSEKYYLDTAGPTVVIGTPVQTGGVNHAFYVPFRIADDASGVAQLPATLSVGGGGSSAALKLAVTGTTDAPGNWTDGSFGTSVAFRQTGAQQYLHVMPAGGEYDIKDTATVTFNLMDYAGNKDAVTSSPLAGVRLDTVKPDATAGTSERTYDNINNEGILTAQIVAEDGGGLSSVRYQWAASGVQLTPEDGGWTDAVGVLDNDPTSAVMTATATVPSGGAFQKTLWARVEDVAGNSNAVALGEYSYSLLGIRYALSYPTKIVTEPELRVTDLEAGGLLVFDVRKQDEPGTAYVKLVTNAYDVDLFNSTWYSASFSQEDGYAYTGLSADDRFLDDYTGNLSVTVYSGNSETITSAYDGADISITTNAHRETVMLRVSASDNGTAAVFTGTNLFSVPAGTSRVTELPWRFDGGESVLDTLDGVQAVINLGDDRNGWGFYDIDWLNSYIAIDGTFLCGIGSGPSQTVTLPASDLYTEGVHQLSLTLARFSDSSTYTYYPDEPVYLDGTRPGSLMLGILVKENSLYPGAYEDLAYDQTSVIYVPTRGYNAALYVVAVDASGAEVELEEPYYEGALDIVAWNAAAPETVISLEDKYFERYVYDDYVSINSFDDWSHTTGKRTLRFGPDTDPATATIGVTAGEDNTVALQIRYANGKRSAVTYITVHPVDMSLAGDILVSKPGDGIVTVDPYEGYITFVPANGINTASMTLYCQEGFRYEDGTYAMMGGYGGDEGEMTPFGDGTYYYVIPTADAEGFESARNLYAIDSENNPHPGRYNGIYEPVRLEEHGDALEYENLLEGQPVGFYVVYGKDAYGNMVVAGVSDSAIIADGSMPIVSEKAIEVDGNTYTATFVIRDDSLFSGTDPVELAFSYDDAYAAAIHADSEKLVLGNVGDGYRWTAEESNRLGILSVSADLTRTGSFDGGADFFKAETYVGGYTDAYLTVTVQGVVYPEIPDGSELTLNLTVEDVHGNRLVTDPFKDAEDTLELVGVTTTVDGYEPGVVAERYDLTGDGTDRALYLTFNTPVMPATSWIDRSISGFDTEWHDAFPIWKDGVWEISYTDLFGNHYVEELTLDGVFGEYGIDLSFSSDPDVYVSSTEGLTITAAADGENEVVEGSVTATVSGSYTVTRTRGGDVDTLTIDLDHIVSGGPKHTLTFYFDERMEQFTEDNCPAGETAGAVTVSYYTSRETSPVSDTALTFVYGEDDSFSFEYYDAPTGVIYTISGRLSDYGIVLAPPAVPYEDNEAPEIGLVSVWRKVGDGYVQSQAFPKSADEAAVLNAISLAGMARGYDLVVSASDYSRWKAVVKTAVPGSITYVSAESDTIPGVTVNGNNILISEEAADDFYIVLVDNAAADSAATSDNFTWVKIPSGGYWFDTTPPEIATLTVADNMYQKTVYVKASDADNNGDPTGAVTLTGAGLEVNTGANAAEYPYKLVFSDNETVAVVTATDLVGNQTSLPVNVTGIDSNAPELTVEWSPCFVDPVTGALVHNSPSAGPVKEDVVAQVASSKDIKTVTAAYSVGGGAETPYDFGTGAGWGRIEYTSERVTVFFENPGDEIAVRLTVTAPNGKSTDTIVTLGAGVIDKIRPAVVTHTAEPSVRAGYSVAWSETHTYLFNEDVFCMDAGRPGTVYNALNPFTLTLTETGTRSLQFADRAGNLSEIVLTSCEIDSVAPDIDVELAVDADATNSAVDVTVVSSENAVLTSSDPAAVCGALSETVAGGKTVWTGVVTVSKNGTFRLTAADRAGNEGTVTFTVNNIDRTVPTISFTSSVVSVRQDSDPADLAVLLNDGVTLWDNVAVRDGTLAADDSEVRLDTPGLYAVTYTVLDTAGNEGMSTRYVKVVDKNQPVVSIDGVMTENNGIISIRTGPHTLSVGGLKLDGEPYKIKIVSGIYSEGQLKRVQSEIIVTDGVFTTSAEGFYTLHIITQSRQTYRTLIVVED